MTGGGVLRGKRRKGKMTTVPMIHGEMTTFPMMRRERGVGKKDCMSCHALSGPWQRLNRKTLSRFEKSWNCY